jgi:hypothetical protein
MNPLAIFTASHPGRIEDMDDVYNYYNACEPLIEICANYMLSLVFHGGINVSINDDFSESYKKVQRTKRKIKNFMQDNQSEEYKNVIAAGSDPNEKIKKKLKFFNADFNEEIMSVLTMGEHWRKMFGFCPIKIYNDNNLGRKRVSVPAYGTGSFCKVRDPLSDQFIISYRPNDVQSFSGQQVRPGEDYFVFVWPDKAPCGIFDYKSEIKKLWEDWYFLREAKSNFLQADYENSHQTIITTNPGKNANVDQMTAQQTTDESIAQADQERLYESDIGRTQRAVNLSQINNVRKRQLDAERYDPVSGKMKVRRMNALESGHVFPMPIGEQIATAPVPKPRNMSELTAFELHYQNMVCLTMGVPYNFITNNRTFKNDQSQEQKAVFQRVIKIREDMSRFFAFVGDKLFGGESQNMVEYVLEKLKNEKLAKKNVLSIKEKMIRDEAQWKEIFTQLDISGFESVASGLRKIAKTESESTPNETNFDTVTESQRVMEYNNILNKGFVDYVSKMIELDYDKRAYEIQGLVKKNILKLEFKNLPYLSFEPQQEIAYAEQSGAFTDEEFIRTLRNRVGLETDQETLAKLVAERVKKIKERKDMEKAESDARIAKSKGNGPGGKPPKEESEGPGSQTTKKSKDESSKKEKKDSSKKDTITDKNKEKKSDAKKEKK